MWHTDKVAVVVPAYNEERLVRTTLQNIPSFVDKVYVVDDASFDGTWNVLSQLSDPRLVRVRHRINRGVGGAIVSGYYRAIADGIDWIAVMAGDNQMSPSELNSLLEATADGAPIDYIKGNRFMHPRKRAMPRLRFIGSKTLSLLTRWCTGLQVDDCQCGYTLIRASKAAELPLGCLWPRYGYPNDLLALLAQHGGSVAEIPIEPLYGDERSGLHAGHVLSIAARILKRWSYQGVSKPL